MSRFELPDAPPTELATQRVRSGLSPRVIALAAIALLVAVVGVGVMGRAPAVPVPPAVAVAPSPTPAPSTAISATPPTPSASSSVPTSEPTKPFDNASAPLITWLVPDELYEVVLNTGAQQTTTFLPPNYNPGFEGAVTVPGTRHRMVSVSLNSVADINALPAPTKIRDWQFAMPLEAMKRTADTTPFQVFQADLGPATDDPAAPLLQRSKYIFTVNARIRGKFTWFYFYVEIWSNPGFAALD